MSAIGTVLGSLSRVFNPPTHPSRLIARYRVRLFAAGAAGTISTVVFLAGYYLSLSWLPSAFAYPTTEYPVSSWAHRADLSQFFGTLLHPHPPLPSSLTWWIGFAALGGLLAGTGVVYAILLAWSLQSSSPAKGAGVGVGLFFGLAGALTIGNGLHPAIMRNTFPDTGLLLIGWSSWATFQLLVLCIAYGTVLGALYQRFAAKP